MKLTVIEQDNDLLHLALDGSLDMEGVQQISSKFATLTGANKTDTIVDISKMDYLASLGLGMFFTAAKALNLEQKKFVLVKPQELVKKTLLTAKLDKHLLVTDNLAQAQTILKRGTPSGKV